MAKVTMTKGLDSIVAARIVRPHVDGLVDKVANQARKKAPPVKVWNTQRDERVRDPWHTEQDLNRRPANLRFDLRSHPWDMGIGRVGPPTYIDPVHGGMMVGPRTYLDKPGESVPGVWVNIVNCRCFLTQDHTGIARLVRANRARASGTSVRGTVSVTAPLIVEAEFGDEYPNAIGLPPLRAAGTHFMRNAARQVAFQSRATSK